MKNSYEILKNEIQKAYNEFPIGFAFSNEQFENEKKRLNVKNDNELVSIGYGGFIRKADIKKYEKLITENAEKLQNAIASDKTGDDFIKDMFYYELANHEYCVTYDYTETLDACGYTIDDIRKDKRLANGLEKATKEYLDSSKDWM